MMRDYLSFGKVGECNEFFQKYLTAIKFLIPGNALCGGRVNTLNVMN